MFKCMKNVLNQNKRNFLSSKQFSTLIIPDIINNNKIHNSVHNLSTAASYLGEKDVNK